MWFQKKSSLYWTHPTCSMCKVFHSLGHQWSFPLMLLIESMKYSAHLPHAIHDVYEVFPHLPNASHNVWNLSLIHPTVLMVSMKCSPHSPHATHCVCGLALTCPTCSWHLWLKSSPHSPYATHDIYEVFPSLAQLYLWHGIYSVFSSPAPCYLWPWIPPRLPHI